MDRKRLMMVAAALAAVIVVAGGYFLGISPQLQAAAAAQQQQASAASQNVAQTANLAVLKSQFSKLDSLNAQLASKQASVPADVSSAAFIKALTALASSTGVTISNISISPAIAYVAPVVASAAAPVAPTSTASASPSASASATASATPSASASMPLSPTVTTSPLITGTNFSDIPVTMKIQGSYAQMVTFVEGLRKGERLFLLTSIGNGDSASSGSNDPSNNTAGSASSSNAGPGYSIGGLIYALSSSSSANQSQQTATSTAAGTTGSGSSTDTAAGK